MAKIEINLIDPNTEVIALVKGKFVKCKTTGDGFIGISEGKIRRISYEVNLPDEKYDTLNMTIESEYLFTSKEEAMQATGLDQF